MSSKKELKKFLNDLTKDELIKELEKLYSKFSQVKTFYDVELSGDTSSLLNEAKRKIENEYFPLRGFGKARSGEVKKIIADFSKISIYSKDVIDLYLFRFHMAVKFTKSYGDIDEPFYDSAYNAFAKALKLIQQNGYENEFKARCKEIVEELGDIEWRFSDEVQHLFYTYFNKDNEDSLN